ncbi:MAG: ARMT1-like domain-containing protein [Desulfobaccales bacterium]
MRPMHLEPECLPCLRRLVELTVSLATPEPELRRRAYEAAWALVEAEMGPGAIPALIANHFHRLIRELTGNADPFLLRKQAETALLARLARQVIPNPPPAELGALLTLAALGNALDFFRPEAEVSQEIMKPPDFALWHGEAFAEALAQGPGLMLYLADNAGEQYFDLPLVQGLRALGWEVIYVVKGGPVQNDLTREDLTASGLATALAPVADTGAQTVGLLLGECSPEFRELYARARLILAKGMGHFETLGHLPDPRLFFLLQAKCAPVAGALGVPQGSFVLLWSPAVTPGR